MTRTLTALFFILLFSASISRAQITLDSTIVDTATITGNLHVPWKYYGA
jgi:hypothetical protein